MKKSIEIYLDLIKRKVTEDTIECYSKYLNCFAKRCSENGVHKFGDLKEKQINRCIDYMRLTCCELTINKRFRIIKSVNKYVGLNNKHIAAVPNFRETRKVLEMIREYIKSDAMKEPNALMYKLVFLILMDTGVRRSELVKIERENIDMKNREIKLVKTKNKDERVVFFSAVTLEYIQMMLEIKVDHEYLLHNVDKNRAMNLYDLGYIIKKYKRKFNLKKFHPHIFRHSFITLWLQNGATQKEVSGIKTNDVLDRYWHIAKNQVKESYNLRYNLD